MTDPTLLFSQIITRAEELRLGDPDHYRDYDSPIPSGQVRAVLMALLEYLTDADLGQETNREK